MQRGAQVTPRDLRRLRYFGAISEAVKPFVSEMGRELGDLLADKGDGATAGERLVLEDVARLGLLLRATFAAYLKAPDVELAKTVSTLAGQRRASLAAVGLERRAREVTVAAVVAEIEAAAQDAPSGANGAAPDAEVEDAHEVAGESA